MERRITFAIATFLVCMCLVGVADLTDNSSNVTAIQYVGFNIILFVFSGTAAFVVFQLTKKGE